MFFEACDSSPERYPVPLSGCNSNLAPWGNCCCAPMVSAGAAWLGLPARVSHCFEVGEGIGASLGRTPGFSKKGRATRRVNLSVSSYMENGGLAILPSLADRGIKKTQTQKTLNLRREGSLSFPPCSCGVRLSALAILLAHL